MHPVNPVPGAGPGRPRPDDESRRWLDALRSDDARRPDAMARLHQLLLKAAHTEARRRRAGLPAAVVADLDHICGQAADDALLAITSKLDNFEGRSRFSTWAYKFAVFEVSTQLRRQSWRRRHVTLDDEGWRRLTDHTAPTAQDRVEQRELLTDLGHAIASQLTDHQRHVFTAIAIDGVPADVVAERLGGTRNAVYKVLHDARRKLRAALATHGHPELAP